MTPDKGGGLESLILPKGGTVLRTVIAAEGLQAGKRHDQINLEKKSISVVTKTAGRGL